MNEPAEVGRRAESEEYVRAERRLIDALAAETPNASRSGREGGVVAAIAGRFRPLVERVLGDRRVLTARATMAGNDAAGGALLAAGLAFHALFALLPGLLLLAGAAGLLIQDLDTRRRVLIELIQRVPPLAGPVGTTLDQLAENPGAVSLLGLVGLAWGASNFYGSLDEAMLRLFPGGRMRGFFERRLRGFLSVGVLLGAAAASVVLSSAWSLVEGSLGGAREVVFWRLAGPLSTVLLMSIAVLFVYLTVPTAPPSLRRALLPALLVGLGIALLTNVFTLLTPRLVGALSAFGAVLAALFGALIWLNYVFQLLLIGAAWARIRMVGLDPTGEQPAEH